MSTRAPTQSLAVQPAEAIRPPFDALELLVVEIAKRDRLRCPYCEGRFGRVARLLFGIKPVRPLANPRLEALRLLVLALRQRWNPARAVAAARAAGIVDVQIEFLFGLRTAPA